MTLEGLVLLIPAKADEERDAVADAWKQQGGQVTRLDRFWEPPSLPPDRVRVYGPDVFALVVAQQLGLQLLEPDPRILAKCPTHLLGRSVELVSLEAAYRGTFPAFFKSVVPKQLPSRIYQTSSELEAAASGLAPDVELVCSSVVDMLAEARAFVLEGVVACCSIYEGQADVSDAATAALQIAGALELPEACVIDVAQLGDGAWVLLEANAAWGAGLNGCPAARVVACIAHATQVRRS